MSQFIAFTKKEFYESHATWRGYILLIAFILLGVMGPMMAMLTPAILEMMGDMDGVGIVITMPDPTWIDAWAQFFSGTGQMGVVAVAIVFSGIMSSELSQGTLVNLLTKGLKRHTVIFAKFFVATIFWTLAVVVAVTVAYVYTAFYFDPEPINYFLLVFGAPWLMGLFLIALLIFGGVLFGNFAGSLAVCLGVFFGLMLLNIAPAMGRFNPVTLNTGTLGLITGTAAPGDFIPALIITAAAIIILLAGSVLMFNRKRI